MANLALISAVASSGVVVFVVGAVLFLAFRGPTPDVDGPSADNSDAAASD